MLQRPHDTFVSGSADRSDEGRLHPVGYGVHCTDVVAVEVRQDEQVDAVDAEQVEARAEPLAVIAGVHQGDCRPRRPAHEHGVTLTDVARGHGPVRWQTGTHDDARHGDDHHADHEDGTGEQQETEADPARHEHGDGEAHTDDRGSDDAADAGRPRRGGVGQRGRPVGDAADGAGGNPGDGGEHTATPGPDGRGEAGREPHDGDDRCERFGEEVRRHRVRRECCRQRDGHRPARHLRCHGDRQRGGERHPQQPGEQRRQRRSEDDDPRRGEHGQREPERSREPGVDHEHADHGQGDQRHTAHRTPGEVDDQHHDGHHRRSDDRRVRSDEHDEREQERNGDGCTDVARKPHHAPQHHHQPDDHRAVRARDCGEVGQRRRLHRGFGGGIEPAPVADRQPAQQRSARVRKWAGHLDEPPPCPVRHIEQTGGGIGFRRPAQERHERRAAAWLVRLERRRRPQPGPRSERNTVDVGVGGRDGAHRDAETGDVPGPLERPQDGPVRRAEITSEDDLDVDRPRARTVCSEYLRTPPSLPHDHRDRQQRAERRGGHEEPEDHTPVEAVDAEHRERAPAGDDRAADEHPARRTRHADHDRHHDPRDGDRRGDTEIGRSGRQVHRHAALRPGRGRGDRRTDRRRSR